MKLFSKRNKLNLDYLQRDNSFSTQRHKLSPQFLKRKQELVNEEARSRLVSQIQFLSSSKIFLEAYILSEDKEKKKFTLSQTLLDNFSLSELGYKFSKVLKFRDLEIIGIQIGDDEAETMVTIYDDYKLFDLIETIILFSKEDKRKEVISRIDKIFSEEACNWKIIKHLITRNTGENLSDITNQLKDDKLADKLRAYDDFYENDDYVNSAKISADILNIIFSDFLQNNKKKQIESIKENIVNLVVDNVEGKNEKKEEMKEYIEQLLINSKNLSNNIFDVRHSEKHTIKIKNPYIYKLISQNNMSLIEFVVTSLKDEFILSEDWENIKAEYLQKYNINKNMIYFYPEKEKPEIDADDIPF